MDSVFAANPNVNVLYACEDGNAFIDKRMADNHCALYKITYDVVERKEVKPKKEKEK